MGKPGQRGIQKGHCYIKIALKFSGFGQQTRLISYFLRVQNLGGVAGCLLHKTAIRLAAWAAVISKLGWEGFTS